MQGENQDRWKLSEYLHRPIPIEGRDVIGNKKLVSCRNLKLTCILERRKERKWHRERGKKKKNLGNRIAATTQGRKMIMSEIERARMNS